MATSLFAYLLLGLLLITFGLFGVLVRRNIVIILICVEMILNGINVTLLALNQYATGGAAPGEIMAIFIIALAAAETTIALALVFLAFSHYREVNIETMNDLKG